MNAASRGQQELLATLFQEHSLPLRGMLWGLLRNRDAVEDVLQTTFAKALESVGEVREASWKSWLFQVAYNEAMLVKRKEGVQQRAFQKVCRGSSDAVETWPGDQLATREMVDRVSRCLLQLPRSSRKSSSGEFMETRRLPKLRLIWGSLWELF